MRTSQITRSRKYKVALGNYENVEIGATVVVQFEEGEEPADNLNAILNTQLDDVLRRDLGNAYDLTSDPNTFVTSDEFADYR